MKIALAQLNYIVGDLDFNSQKIITAIEQANQDQADLIIFSELSVTGYSPEDLLTYPSFITKTAKKIHEIASFSKQLDVIIGAPLHENGKLFNAAYHLSEGKIKQIVKKTLLPTYDVFDEKRYFSPSDKLNCIEIKGQKVALVICEDTWIIEESPLHTLWNEKPSFIINISASPFSRTHQEARFQMANKIQKNFPVPFIYVNQIGANTELIFDGNSFVQLSNHERVCELPPFQEKIQTIDFAQNTTTHLPIPEIELTRQALVLGIKDYFQKSGFKKAVLGLSGGVDSALTATLAVQALGKENVVGILLPSQYSSNHSIKDAEDLAKNLAIETHTIAIENSFQTIENTLAPVFQNQPADLTEENIQARIRGLILMAYSNKFGAMLLNTSNKSEMAVGYGTLYGDMCGGLAVLGDVYKTMVYELCNWINKEHEIIPNNTIIKAPSAELRPNQTDQDSLPPYDILDQIIFHYVENQLEASEIIHLGFPKEIVEKSLQLIKRNEYKRYQAAPILRVTNKAFGIGRKMPIVAKL